MQIGDIISGVTSLGINSRVCIWTLGCLKHCPGCISIEFQFFDASKEMSVPSIIEKLKTMKFQGVTISGGEPFLWGKELCELVKAIKDNFTDDILIYSGYTLQELKDKKDRYINEILNNIAVLVDGPFIQELRDNILLRGSKNQQIIILNPKYLKPYQDYLKQDKKVNVIRKGKGAIVIGVPFEKLSDAKVEPMQEDNKYE